MESGPVGYVGSKQNLDLQPSERYLCDKMCQVWRMKLTGCVAKWKTVGSYSEGKRRLLNYVTNLLSFQSLRIAGRKVAPAFILSSLGTYAHCSGTPHIMSKLFQLTPEQLALSEQRKAKRAKLKAATVDETKGHILRRKWVQLSVALDIDAYRPVKVMTWNVSASCSAHNAFNNSLVYSYLRNVLSVSHAYLFVIEWPQTWLSRT